MSVVIVGGNERMVTQYKEICKEFGYKAKVFAKMATDLRKKDWNTRFDYSFYKYCIS